MEFFNKFEDIGKLQLLMHSQLLMHLSANKSKKKFCPHKILANFQIDTLIK